MNAEKENTTGEETHIQKDILENSKTNHEYSPKTLISEMIHGLKVPRPETHQRQLQETDSARLQVEWQTAVPCWIRGIHDKSENTAEPKAFPRTGDATAMAELFHA